MKHFQLPYSCFLCQGEGRGSRELSLTQGLWSNLSKPLIERRQLDSDLMIFCLLVVVGTSAIFMPQCIILDLPFYLLLLDFQIENIDGKCIQCKFYTMNWTFPGLTSQDEPLIAACRSHWRNHGISSSSNASRIHSILQLFVSFTFQFRKSHILIVLVKSVLELCCSCIAWHSWLNLHL